MVKVLFFGSSIHSLKIIEAIKKIPQTEIVGFVSQPDKPVGRKQILTPTPVSDYANKNNLPVFKPQSEANKPTELKDKQKLLDFVKSLNPDLIIVSYYGQKIPTEVINLPTKGAINIHPSLLPNYPGSSPAVWAILNGESKTGVSIIKMNENFDAGEIIAQEEENIKNTDTPEDLYERLFTKGASLLETTLQDYLNGKIIPHPQGLRTSVYARRLTKEDGKIDWSKSPEYLERFMRAMYPWPGAWSEVTVENSTKKLAVIKSHIENGKLVLDLVRLEGKNPVTYKQLKEGYPSLTLPNI